jgi:hypothetical protein
MPTSSRAAPTLGSAGGEGGAGGSGADIDLQTLKKYIAFARTKCAPRLTPDAAKALAVSGGVAFSARGATRSCHPMIADDIS